MSMHNKKGIGNVPFAYHPEYCMQARPFRGQHTFSAGEGHTATGSIVKELVGFDLLKNFLHCVVFSAYFPGTDRAILGAFSAQGTFSFPATAYLFAHAAGNALALVEQKFRMFFLTLRVVAPATAQIAPFEKHSGSDTRTVDHREFLCVKYITCQPSFHRNFW